MAVIAFQAPPGCTLFARGLMTWQAPIAHHILEDIVGRVTRDESRFHLSRDDNGVRVWRPHGGRLNSAFALQRHTDPTTGVMVWGDSAYNT
ncbi:hypothetical protein TNCV_4567901 [Trichonephila clavipes]|nr:hypothetical protein TNCV_4567901 [Trichonephila clavipes]